MGTKRSLKSETTNRGSLLGDRCQKEVCEASGKPKAVRSGWVFEVSGDLAQCLPAAKNAFAEAEEPKNLPIETGHPAGRVTLGKCGSRKVRQPMTREAVHTGRAMSPNVASRAGLDRG